MKKRVHFVLLHTAAFVRKRLWLKRAALKALTYTPGLRERLVLTINNNQHSLLGTLPDIATDYSQLNPRARRIYAKLKDIDRRSRRGAF